ncbi:MAG: hypothetical protein ACTSRA_08160, partial [Promethearchaeota archaeon]
KARVELGLETPQVKRGSKKSERERRLIEVFFNKKELGEPLHLDVGFYRVEDGDKRRSSLRILVDEREKIIAHENCPDFKIRMAPQHKFCKHLVEMLLSLDDAVARRVIELSTRSQFLSSIPAPKLKESEIPERILESVGPSVEDDNLETLKNEIMDYLMENEDDESKTSFNSLKERFGEDVESVLKILINEGMIRKTGAGNYKPA